MKKRIDDLKAKLGSCQDKIDHINLNDEEKYKKKSEKLENLKRDIRTLYLNKLYIDCSLNETIEVPHEQLAKEVKHMESTAKQLLSEFNVLLGRLKKEERIKYSLQKALQEKPLEAGLKKIQIADCQEVLFRANEELNYLKDKMGIDDEQVLHEMLETCDPKAFEEKKTRYFETQIA